MNTLGQRNSATTSAGLVSLPNDQDASGRSLGSEEIELVVAAIQAGTLFGPKGRYVSELEEGFAEWLGTGAAVAASSGTAAIHAVIAGISPEPGDEIVTTPVTDIGAITPILYQGAIPVFADVDPTSGNVTADSISERLSERTRAIIVTHLFGTPVDLDPVLEAAGEIPVIEDCAQAYGATIDERRVGSLGVAGTFSLQQGKHITSGEGGLIATSDRDLACRARLFVNKAWDYDDPSDHDFLALNYRMSELQAAVAVAQLGKLDRGIDTRRALAVRLSDYLERIDGLAPVACPPGGQSSYWRYALMVDPDVINGGAVGLGQELKDLGIPAAPRYIKKPAFQTRLFQEQETFGSSKWPFSLARPDAVDHSIDRYPGTRHFLDRVLVLPWNERFTDDHVDEIALGISAAVRALASEAA